MSEKIISNNISASDIAEFFMSFDSPEEVSEGTVKTSLEFTKDCKTLTESIQSLFINDKVPLTLAGVEVTIEVKGLGKQLMYAKLGSTKSTDALYEAINRHFEG